MGMDNTICSITISASPRNMLSANIANRCPNQNSSTKPTRSSVIHTSYHSTWAISLPTRILTELGILSSDL